MANTENTSLPIFFNYVSFHILGEFPTQKTDTVGAVVVTDETTVKPPKRDRNRDWMFGPCR